MRVFVTGAAGFVGAHFVELALAAGHQVTGLVRAGRGKDEKLLKQLRDSGATLCEGEIRDAATLHAVLPDADCVCHFAAAFNDAGATDEHYYRTNVEGTRNVLEAAAARGVRRFVFCGTAGIYGQRVAGLVNERSPAQPWNAYERSKLQAEELIRKRAPELGMEYVILRPAVVYGPRDSRLAKLFRPAARGRFPLFGAGNGRRHMVYVADVAEAFLRACVRPEAAGQELIIAGPEAVPLRELLSTIAAVAQRPRFGIRLPLRPMLILAAVTEDVCGFFGVKPPLYRRRMDFYLSDAAFDCSRALRVLGCAPAISLAEGLARTLSASGFAVRRPHARHCAPAGELIGVNAEMFH